MKTVNELTQEELEELRDRYYHQGIDDGSLDEVMGKEIDSADEIPMDLIKAHYGGTFFVKDDFWVNVKS